MRVIDIRIDIEACAIYLHLAAVRGVDDKRPVIVMDNLEVSFPGEVHHAFAGGPILRLFYAFAFVGIAVYCVRALRRALATDRPSA